MDLINNKINEIVRLVTGGVGMWVQAGELLVELLEIENAKIYERIQVHEPRLNTTILGQLEKLGRKTLHPDLLLGAGPGYEAAMALPYSVQEHVLKNPLHLVVEKDGRTDVLLVDLASLSREQAKQLFGDGRMRSQGEQKAYLVSQAEKRKLSQLQECDVTPAWRIRAGRVEFRAGCTLSAGELATILTQITK